MKIRIAIAFLSAVLVVSCDHVADVSADPDAELAAFNALADIRLSDTDDLRELSRLINELSGLPLDNPVLLPLRGETAELLADGWDDPGCEIGLPAGFMEYRAWLRCVEGAEADEDLYPGNGADH